MNMSETAKLLFIVKANYPKYYKEISKQEFEDMVYAWHICINDYDYNTAQAGLKVFLSSDTKGFPPAVGQIIDGIHKIQRDNTDTLTELDAWGLVYKAICNSGYNSESEYEKLPDIVKRAVGSTARLKEWAMLDTADVQTVIQSNFMRSFRSVQEQRRVYQKIPKDVKRMLPEDTWSKSLKIIDATKAEVIAAEVLPAKTDFVNDLMQQFRESMGI